MELVKISPKYQVVIPKSVRTALGLRPGQKLYVIPFGSRIELVPERKISEMRGFLRGIDTSFERERERL
jgi:AbrB family looped-hinge helix DNA binding protein